MPHDYVAERSHVPGRQSNVQLFGFPRGALPPGAPPFPEGRPDVSQSLQRKHVRRERNDDAIAGDQRGAVDRAEIRADVQQRQIRSELPSGVRDQPRERSRDAECPLVPVQTFWPLRGELVFASGECEVAHQQPDLLADFFDLRRLDDIAGALEQGGDAVVDSARVPISPQTLQPRLVEEHRAQVSLGIEVRGDDTPTEFPQHPGQVIDERRFAHASLVVEEGNGRHGRLRTVTSTNASCTSNSSGGLPFAANVLRAVSMPMPKRCMKPMFFIASAIVGLR